MARDIVLVRYTAPPFKDHWAIFIPSAQNPKFGTLIQVEGDVRSGFHHNIRRNYDLKHTTRNVQTNLIGRVADKHVHSTPSQGTLVRDAPNTKDDCERVALSVPAPGPSMRPTAGNAVRSCSLYSILNEALFLTQIIASSPPSEL